MLNIDFLNYAVIFSLLFVVLNSIYEVGYIYNDYVRIKYDEKPHIRRYVNEIHVPVAAALRVIYVITASAIFLSLPYVYAVALLLFSLLNHNLRTKKIQKAMSLPLLRVAKYMFIPIALSSFNLEVIGASLIIMLPLFMLEGETIAYVIIDHYEKLRTSLRFPYYMWFLTFLPLQLLLLIKYPI